ncbi:uncharacterized protein LOC142974471 isoform X2 [Anticarsia gemmatalis]|uniref:uncharacterized protein LOC142974471 isoform X2 n=1 Tax=Anticarsia gemmatalis TaxID=129554 RepID=UPI003F76B89C
MRSPAPTPATRSHTTTLTTVTTETTETETCQPPNYLHTQIFNMLMKKAVQLTVLAAAVLLDCRTDAATTAAVKFCGRQLSVIMSRVCHAYNSPSWDVPTVEQPGSVARRRRQVGIADECCIIGCTWDQLSEYCSISAYSESPLEDMEAHIIADRSAEQGTAESRDASPPAAAAAAAVGSAGHATGRRGGRPRSRGYGRARRGRRCWCRRKRRSGRRRSSLMGNMGPAKSVVHRAAPVVGTVSPLITWGRTLNTDLSRGRNGYAYVVYT